MSRNEPGRQASTTRIEDLAEGATSKSIEQQDSGLQRQESGHVNLDPESTKNGIAQLVLTLIKFLHELLSKQAVRRMEAGTLTEEEIERLGLALMKQAQELERMRKEFGLEEEDLNLDLGPLGKLM